MGANPGRCEDLSYDAVEIASDLVCRDVFDLPGDSTQSSITLAIGREPVEVTEHAIHLDTESQAPVAEIDEGPATVAERHFYLGFQW